jgi:hypothetical protein
LGGHFIEPCRRLKLCGFDGGLGWTANTKPVDRRIRQTQVGRLYLTLSEMMALTKSPDLAALAQDASRPLGKAVAM